MPRAFDLSQVVLLFVKKIVVAWVTLALFLVAEGQAAATLAPRHFLATVRGNVVPVETLNLGNDQVFLPQRFERLE